MKAAGFLWCEGEQCGITLGAGKLRCWEGEGWCLHKCVEKTVLRFELRQKFLTVQFSITQNCNPDKSVSLVLF